MKPLAKVIISALISAVLGFIWYAIIAFGGVDTLSTIVYTTSFIAVVFSFIAALMFGWLKTAKGWIGAGILATVVALCIFSLESYKSYVTSIKFTEQGVDLRLYAPFADNTKAVSLNEASDLKFTDDLPVLDGATALYPVYSAFARAVYPEENYNSYKSDVVSFSNTVGAYDSLIDGKADVIFVASPSKEQQQKAKDKGIELKFTPIGREAFVFFVNAKNPVNNLSIEGIKNIYSGRTNNWKDFGGNNEKIRAFQRPENSGSQTMIQKIMEDTPLMTPPKEDVASGMGGIIQQTATYENHKNAIGYSFLFFSTQMVNDNKIKLISINEIFPSRETIFDKTYPYSAEFYAVTANSKNKNTQKLIDWILSSQGQYLVEKTGYTPIK